MVLRVCRRILGPGPDAEDAAQETFERHLGSDFEGRSSLATYLYAIATRVCIDRLRKIRRDERLMRDWSDAARMRQAAADPRADNMLLVARLLDNPELGDDMAQSAVCYYVHGMTEQEISDALGINRRTVSYKISRFVALTRELVEDKESHG
jgi:RNA polymerase sigma-70 factor (ECF subfamily)